MSSSNSKFSCETVCLYSQLQNRYDYHYITIQNVTQPSLPAYTTSTYNRKLESMLLSTTRNEPVHYMLKIEFFSVLSDQDRTIKIESDVFEAAGHKWRLEFYPNGHDEKMGGKHISLYLIICDAEGLSKAWGASFDVNFYVYDHIRHSYVTIQDVGGNRTRFHEKQTKWGFDKLISLEDFREKSKGYLFNDSCVFGAEVFAVSEYAVKDRCLSMIKLPSNMNTFTWTLDNFSGLTGIYSTSEIFKLGKVKWDLSLCFTEQNAGAGKDMSIKMRGHEAWMKNDSWRVYALFEIRVKNQCGYDDKVQEIDHWFCNSSYICGFSRFMSLSELSDTTKGFLLNDSVIVEAKISVIGMLKCFI